MNRLVLLAAAILLLLLGAQTAGADDLAEVQQQFDAGNYSGAMNTLRALVSQSPANAADHFWMGRCYYEMRDYSDAVSELEKATQLEPNSSFITTGWGVHTVQWPTRKKASSWPDV